MKKIFFDFVSFANKNIFALILVMLLVILTSCFIKTKTDLNKYIINKNIDGTFMSIDDLSQKQTTDPNIQYFTFKRGKFYRYRQFELMEKGTYENIDDHVYILKGDHIDECIIYTNERFYFYDRKENDVIKFLKVSDVPTFINIHVD
ncbi:hypothetical protein [Inediibacterium massiliense]|uniref:hypothetical protein n=1 Tax=Inediibacterium massiliense TaxID=1658111 RepID=UPI0006B490FE|nr:hypothetical protein [Inediibacterium massiliense]